MSLGLVVLEKKLFKRTRTPQGDAIMSPDSQVNQHKYTKMQVSTKTRKIRVLILDTKCKRICHKKAIYHS